MLNLFSAKEIKLDDATISLSPAMPEKMVIEGDIACTNGAMHKVDKVLMPKMPVSLLTGFPYISLFSNLGLGLFI